MAKEARPAPPPDRKELSEKQYRKKAAKPAGIFKREVLVGIGQKRAKVLGRKPFWYPRLIEGWESLSTALEERKPGALGQAWNFIHQEVSPRVLRLYQSDAEYQINRFENEFPEREGPLSRARELLESSRDQSLKYEQRINAAKSSRHEAAKALALEFKRFEQKLRSNGSAASQAQAKEEARRSAMAEASEEARQQQEDAVSSLLMQIQTAAS